ncbi:MAG: hypothetical protein GY804_08075 [Alphaproteobacteria bacterium]|nr:hypothetical protein [Alphaproteobacteria bacterium]
MDKSLAVLVAGLTGVFVGMLMLYISVKATAFVVDKMPKAEEKKEVK